MVGPPGGAELGDAPSTASASEFLTVAIRVRPLMPRSEDIINIIQRGDDDEQLVQVRDPGGHEQDTQKFSKRRQLEDKQFSFRPVFDRYADHGTLFNTSVKPLITKVLQGYSATVFAYGHTGSGKTHTMLGTERDAGVALLSLSSLFETLQEHQSITARITMSFAEVFEENVYDLMADGVDEGKESLELREDETGSTVVLGLGEHEVRVIDEAYELVYQAQSRRSTEETRWNVASSRSHAIFTVYMYLREDERSPVGPSSHHPGASPDPSWWSSSLDSWNSDAVGKLRFVDLAGSERYTGDNKRTQTKTINQSLLALSTCLACLGDKSSQKAHVPFRDSKLTRLLKDMLLGRAHSVMISCISPSDQHYDETVNTLTYSMHARHIRVNAALGVRARPVTVDEYDHVIQDLKGQVASLRLALAEAQRIPSHNDELTSLSSVTDPDAAAGDDSSLSPVRSDHSPRPVTTHGRPPSGRDRDKDKDKPSGASSSSTRIAAIGRETQQRLDTLLREQAGLVRHLARLRARHVDGSFDLHHMRMRKEVVGRQGSSGNIPGDNGSGPPPVAPVPSIASLAASQQRPSLLKRIMKRHTSTTDEPATSSPGLPPSESDVSPDGLAQIQQMLSDLEAESRGLLDRYVECEVNRKWVMQQARAALIPDDVRKSLSMTGLPAPTVGHHDSDTSLVNDRQSTSSDALVQSNSLVPTSEAEMAWRALELTASLHRSMLHDLKLQVRGQNMQRLLQLQHYMLCTHDIVSMPTSSTAANDGFAKLLALDSHLARCSSCISGCIPSADGRTAAALFVGPPKRGDSATTTAGYDFQLLKPSCGFRLAGYEWALDLPAPETGDHPLSVALALSDDDLKLGDAEDSLTGTTRGRRLTHLEWHPKNINTPRSSREHQKRLRRVSLYVAATSSGVPGGPRSATGSVRSGWGSGDLPTSKALAAAERQDHSTAPVSTPSSRPSQPPVAPAAAQSGGQTEFGASTAATVSSSTGGKHTPVTSSPPKSHVNLVTPNESLRVLGVGQHVDSSHASVPDPPTNVITGDRSLPHQHPGGIALAEGIASESFAADINTEMKLVRHRLDELLDAKYSMLRVQHEAFKKAGQSPGDAPRQLNRSNPPKRMHRRSVSDGLADGPLQSLLGKMGGGKGPNGEGLPPRPAKDTKALSPTKRRQRSSSAVGSPAYGGPVPELYVTSVGKEARDQSLPPSRPGRKARLRGNKSENTLARRLASSPLRGARGSGLAKAKSNDDAASGTSGSTRGQDRSPVPRLRLDALNLSDSGAPNGSPSQETQGKTIGHSRAASADVALPVFQKAVIVKRKGGRRSSSALGQYRLK